MSVPITVTRLDHIGVMVADIEAVVSWYTDSLGFEVLDRWVNADAQMAWAHLELHGFRIEFVERQGLMTPDPTAAGYHHIALVVPDCAQAVDALVRAGASVVFPPSYFDRHDMDWSFVQDPFGNILELVSYRSPHTPQRP
ncbi:VOC family protein [Microbacterium pumilum]|uniref:VOC domain-containing protein n=1 Tax=Microbacterium pumilum TaxID=344165 RepID=A0ABN2RP70_9MICO